MDERFRKISNPTRRLLFVFSVTLAFTFAKNLSAQEAIPDNVLDILDENCAISGCHAGTTAPKGLDLTEDFALSGLVNKPSDDRSEIMRVKPQDPVNSYLMMKLRGSAGIRGERMPKGGGPLSNSELSAIETWINSLPAGMTAKVPERKHTDPFPALTVATLPTPHTLETGLFFYRIAHRWRGKVESGFGNFFGLDEGAHMFTQLAFAFTNDIMFQVARSGENATFEFASKWRFMREKTDGSVPISAAIIAGLDWETLKDIADPENPTQFLGRSDGERFHFFGQLALSKQVGKRLSFLLVPGILVNGNVNIKDEDAIFTIGFAGKVMLSEGFSIFVEGVPILSGSETAATVGGPRPDGSDFVINDAFTIGLERKIGGHVFHVYITNSLGLAANQYMSGGNFDASSGEFRLGFNIYRILRLP